ncbi:hypothetical protein H8A99_04075 [Bradyrhizobium sp. Arg68]|uniref:DUF2231 domain-containing protein n=1 Tax=Bradyrhizobium ivorense TaxID=2511166 RepID=UPI001E59B665|nr:DUF2231 domain-containing protein [Bradyrhizobium ivorense]MCC8935695.1 hypothetical protein [Bradyrhizobium ivorense]
MLHTPSTAQLKLLGTHPTHPMLIPFPAAFLISALATDLAFFATGDRLWAIASMRRPL